MYKVSRYLMVFTVLSLFFCLGEPFLARPFLAQPSLAQASNGNKSVEGQSTSSDVLTGTGEVVTDLFFKPLASDQKPTDKDLSQITDADTCGSHCSIQRKSNLSPCKSSRDEFCEYTVNQNYLNCEKICEDKKSNPPDIANPLFEKTRMPAGSPFEEKFPF